MLNKTKNKKIFDPNKAIDTLTVQKKTAKINTTHPKSFVLYMQYNKPFFRYIFLLDTNKQHKQKRENLIPFYRLQHVILLNVYFIPFCPSEKSPPSHTTSREATRWHNQHNMKFLNKIFLFLFSNSIASPFGHRSFAYFFFLLCYCYQCAVRRRRAGVEKI